MRLPRKKVSQPTIDEKVLMQFDEELSKLVATALSIRTQFGVAEGGKLETGFTDVLAAVAGVREDLAASEARVMSQLALANDMLNDMADQLVDLKQAIVSQGAQIAASQSIRAAVRPPGSSAETLRALIAATDQLGTVAAVGGPHVDVVSGQRANLIRCLEVLGVDEVSPDRASPIDISRVKTDARPALTDDAALDGRVFEVLESGWERSDGSEVLRLPKVRVYEYRESTPEAPEPEAAPVVPQDEVIGIDDEPSHRAPTAVTAPTTDPDVFDQDARPRDDA